MLERLEDLGVDEPWRVAEPLAAAGIDDAWLTAGQRARGPGDRRRGALGGRVADRARPRRRSARLGVAHGRPRHGDQVLRLPGPRRRWCRSTSTKASKTTLIVLGHKLKHTSIDVVKRLRPRAAAAHRARLRAQPGVDEHHRQRDRRDGRERHAHDLHQARRAVRARRHRRRRSGHPAGGPVARARSVLHDQAGRPGDGAGPGHRAPDRRGAPLAGRSASTPARAAPPSTCGCPSRARCADLAPSGHGDLHPYGHDHGDRAARGGGRL